MFIPGELWLIESLNAFAGQNPVLDEVFLRGSRLASVRMLPLVALLWWLWFADQRHRRTVLQGLLGGVLAMVASRTLQNFLPHRPRPSLSGEFDFTLPPGAFVNDWSSFPSDTAALSIALVTGIWLASRPLGILALVWAMVFALFPRLYGGYHYLSDLLAGAAIGAGCVLLVALWRRPFEWAIGTALTFEQRHAGFFYLLAFGLTFQLVTFFEDLRALAGLAARLL